MIGVDMVIVDGIRYRPEDAPKPSEPAIKKAAPAAKNKARQPAPSGDAGPSQGVETK